MPRGATAAISECGLYRYALHRDLQVIDELMGEPVAQRRHAEETVLFVMLNPSTADALTNDPTIERCIAFARRWEFGTLAVANLYAFRSTNPDHLTGAEDAVGPDNDEWIDALAHQASLIVLAWGCSEQVDPVRAYAVCATLDAFPAPMSCLKRTEDGHPAHPLYLAGDLEPEPFTWWEALYG